MSKPTEVDKFFLRQANKNEPAEAVISDGKDLKVYQLRPSQLRQLAYDAVIMALKIRAS